MRRRLRAASVIGLLALCAGCATTPSVMRFENTAGGEGEVWPSAPDVPRYRLVGQLTGESNFAKDDAAQGVGKRMLGWLVGLVTGEQAPRVLQRPQSGFTDAEGRVYVTDVSRGAVYVFDAPAGEMRVWEKADQRARFDTPVGIAPGRNGEILVADAELRRVVRLSAGGQAVGAFGQGELVRPVGLARDAAGGRVFVADAQADAVVIFNDAGERIGTIGRRGEGPGEFNSPTYLAYAGGRLLVADTLNARIQMFDAAGEYLGQFGRRGLFIGDFTRPKGVAADTDGNIYVVESYYDYLLVFNQHGELLLPIGGTGSGNGEFFLPAGIWIDDRNQVYVADAFNGRVMVFEYLGGT
jgi:DNA-binding beta-propeller fold protein YncE